MFGGVYSRDSKLKLENKFYIFNLDDELGPGTHWVVVYNVIRHSAPHRVIYFDPFGVNPPKEILKLMRCSRKQIIMNTYRIQDLKSESCGLFCLYVIDHLNNNEPFIEILTDFDSKNYQNNEKILAKYF